MVRINNWVYPLAVMTIIFIVSATPGETINAVGLGYEPLHINGHFFLFFLLCISFFKATKNLINSILLTILYGILDEAHQILTPFREPSFFDIYVDTLGALSAGVLLWKLQCILPKKLINWLNS